MPLSQRDQYSDRKGMGLVRFGGVTCLGAFLFGSLCFTIAAVMGEGEDPPKILEQMGAASCGLFSLGLILSLVGWLVSLNQPSQPKPRLTGRLLVDDDIEEASVEPNELAEAKQDDEPKPDPYASDHRRREY